MIKHFVSICRGTIYNWGILTACAARDLDNRGLRGLFIAAKARGFLLSYAGICGVISMAPDGQHSSHKYET